MSTEIKNPRIGGVKVQKLPKDHLRLPDFHFITATDWIDKLGQRAFCAYLKMFTLGDRKGKSLKEDAAIIPRSLDQIRAEIKGGAKTTFYDKVIKPLWNYGLIDLEEYEESKRTSQKPVNIIVYPYPNMEFERMVLPLEKIRDYDTDYNSKAKIHATKKKVKVDENVDLDTVQKLDGAIDNENDENVDLDTVQKLDGANSTVQKLDGDRLKNGRNNLYKSFNNSLEEKEEEEEEEEVISYSKNLSSKTLNHLKAFSIDFGFTEEEASLLVSLVKNQNIDDLSEEIIYQAFSEVLDDIEKGLKIYDLVKWTAGKIDRVVQRVKLASKRTPKKQKEGSKGNKSTNPKKRSYGANFKREEVVPDWLKAQKENEAANSNQQGSENGEPEEDFQTRKEALQARLREKYKKNGN